MWRGFLNWLHTDIEAFLEPPFYGASRCLYAWACVVEGHGSRVKRGEWAFFMQIGGWKAKLGQGSWHLCRETLRREWAEACHLHFTALLGAFPAVWPHVERLICDACLPRSSPPDPSQISLSSTHLIRPCLPAPLLLHGFFGYPLYAELWPALCLN